MLFYSVGYSVSLSLLALILIVLQSTTENVSGWCLNPSTFPQCFLDTPLYSSALELFTINPIKTKFTNWITMAVNNFFLSLEVLFCSLYTYKYTLNLSVFSFTNFILLYNLLNNL